jgi:hypothetical protein
MDHLLSKELFGPDTFVSRRKTPEIFLDLLVIKSRNSCHFLVFKETKNPPMRWVFW